MAEFAPAEGISAGAFWVFGKENLTQTDVHWLGANGSYTGGPVNIDVEGVILTGSVDGLPSPGDIDLEGWALVGDARLCC